MRKAILHIGTEKTGSTSIQSALHARYEENRSKGCLFPYRTCGMISNYRLVLYALEKPASIFASWEKQSFDADVSQNIDVDFKAWKERFRSDHSSSIEDFQRKHRDSVVIYSSEHFHSRVHGRAEIESLKAHLEELYDEIHIVFYVRRQDRLAISAHNTAIQAGNENWFDFGTLPGNGVYYDYLSLAERWSAAFGHERVVPKIYEPGRLVDDDVVADFQTYAAVPAYAAVRARPGSSAYESSISGPTKFRTPKLTDFIKNNSPQKNASRVSENARLSFTALSALILFNRLDDEDPLLGGRTKESLRKELVIRLHDIKDGHGEVLPARAEAERFYRNYSEGNDLLAEKWLDGKGFSDDFSTYPARPVERPEVDAESVLTGILANMSSTGVG